MSNKPTLDEILHAHRFASQSNEAKQQLTQLIADIIGEIEHEELVGKNADMRRRGRNQLISLQRQRAKERGIDL